MSLGIFLQIWYFESLISFEYIFISIVTVLCATISQLDFGLANLLTSKHIRNLDNSDYRRNEIHELISLVDLNRNKLIKLILSWAILSSVVIFGIIHFEFENIAGRIHTGAIASVVILFNGLGAFTTRILLALGVSNRILEIQLIAVVGQISLFLFDQSVLMVFAGLSIYPILTLHLAIRQFFSVKHDPNARVLTGQNNLKVHVALLQIAQIFGILTSLAVPILAVANLSDRAASIIQFQFKVASVAIAAMGALYINIQRDSARTEIYSFIRRVILISSLSTLFTATGVIAILHLKILINLGSEMPNILSWTSLVLYVGIQPINISIYYFIMHYQYYSTIALSGGINILALLILISFAPNDINWYFTSILLATILSGFPLYFRFRRQLLH